MKLCITHLIQYPYNKRTVNPNCTGYFFFYSPFIQDIILLVPRICFAEEVLKEYQSFCGTPALRVGRRKTGFQQLGVRIKVRHLSSWVCVYKGPHTFPKPHTYDPICTLPKAHKNNPLCPPFTFQTSYKGTLNLVAAARFAIF